MSTAQKPTPRSAAPSGRARSALIGAVVVLVTLAALVATAWLYTRVFAPERRAAARAPATVFDSRAMRAATTPDAV